MPTWTEIRRNRRQPHRPCRCHAAVELLDARRLMAASITGTTIPVTGEVGSPLRVKERPFFGPFSLGGPYSPDAPLGTPIPLVSLTDGSACPLPATGYSGTVDWGDGSPAVAAVFGNNPLLSYAPIPDNVLTVNGPEHTYATPGTFTIIVSVTGPGDSTPLAFTTTATISANPILTGALDPASDTGFFNNDFVTADTTPTFTGTTGARATVVLAATSVSTGQTLVVGTTVADTAGNWSVTTVPFVDGGYEIRTTATNAFGGSTTLPMPNPFGGGFGITIDATGPTVSGFQVTNLKTGTFRVDYSDPAGLLISPTVDTNLIAVTRTSPALRGGQASRVTSLTAQKPGNTGYVLPTSSFIPVVGTFTTGKPIPRNGTYTFTIYSAGIVGLSGAPLDGEFNGKFPSGNGLAGGNFQVKINVRNGKVSGPLPLSSASIATRAVAARAATRPRA